MSLPAALEGSDAGLYISTELRKTRWQIYARADAAMQSFLRSPSEATYRTKGSFGKLQLI